MGKTKYLSVYACDTKQTNKQTNKNNTCFNYVLTYIQDHEPKEGYEWNRKYLLHLAVNISIKPNPLYINTIAADVNTL